MAARSEALLRRLGIGLPLVQAPMAGGPTTPALVAAVGAAGGLGSLACAALTPQAILDGAAAIRAATNRPFALNLFTGGYGQADPAAVAAAKARLQPYHDALGLGPVADPPPPPDQAAQLAAVIEARPPVFSFTFGLPPADAVRRLQAGGTLVIGTATHPAEIDALVDVGVDAVTLQGAEAGGHRGTFIGAFPDGMIGTLALVQLARARTELPLIAAGGIATAAGVRAALAAGADAVACGTAFLRADEAGTSQAWRDALAGPLAQATIVTRAFSGRPARGLVNRYLREMADFADHAPAYPTMNVMTGPLRAAAAKAGEPELLSLWAGQAAPLARAAPAAAIVADLTP